MLVTLALAAVGALLIGCLVYCWHWLEPLVFFRHKDLCWRQLGSLRLWIRSPGPRVDFDAAGTGCHYSLEDGGFAGAPVGVVVWGSRLALCLERVSWGFSGSQFKFVLKIGRASVYCPVLAAMFSQPTSTKTRASHRMARRLVVVVQSLVALEIGELDVVTTVYPDGIGSCDSLFLAGINLQEIQLFKERDLVTLQSRPLLSVGRIAGKLTEYSTSSFAVLAAPQKILHVDSGRVNIVLTDLAMRFDVFLGETRVDVHVAALLFVGTLVRMGRRAQERPHHAVIRLLVTCKLSALHVFCHLPDLDKSLKPISTVKLELGPTQLDLILDRADFKYFGHCSHAHLSAFFSATADGRCFTLLDHILQRIPSPETEHVLLGVEKLTVSNSEHLLKTTKTEVLPKDSVRDLIMSLLDGKVCWDYLKNFSQPAGLDLNQMLEVAELGNIIEYLSFGSHVPSAVILLLAELSFSIPFEFPLSAMVEHLALMVKAPIMMFDPEVRPQAFDLFRAKWELILSCPLVQWSFGDDPFEARLARVFDAKRRFYPRHHRLDKMFWARAAKETADMQGGQLNTSQTSLARSASHSDLLEGRGVLVNKYAAFQHRVLGLYKRAVDSAAGGGALMRVCVGDVDVKLKWNPDFLGRYGIHDLLNALENSATGYTPEMVRGFSLFLGAYLEFSGHNATVTLRDYEGEFVSVSHFQLCGPVFLVEEGAYASACIPVALATGCSTARSNACPGTVWVTETILPVKFFHSLGARLSGEYGFRAAFCPLWDGMFVGLDRAFDMLAKQTRESSPRLAIWDKFRLFVHSTYGFVYSDAPCRFTFFPGKTPAMEESLVVELLRGFTFENRPDCLIYEFGSFDMLVGSRSLSVLRQCLEGSGQFRVVTDSGRLLQLLHFARTRFTLRLEGANLSGVAPVEHQLVRVVARSADAALDSYRDFRLGSINVHLNVETDDTAKADVTTLSLYDELIEWITRNLLGYTVTTVRKGPLFVSPFIVLNTGQKDVLLSIIEEIHFRFHFEGLFSCLYLNFFDAAAYGGLHLTSTETFISLDYAKAAATAGVERTWVYYYGEVDLKSAALNVVTSDRVATNWSQEYRQPVPAGQMGEDVTALTIICAPRLFYVCSNDRCFERDPKARASQQRSLEGHRAARMRRIQQLARADGDEARQEVAVLTEQQRLISDSSSKSERHFYFIHDAKLFWYRGLRDSVYHFIDQQFVRHIIRVGRARSVLETLWGAGPPAGAPAGARRPRSPVSRAARRAAGNSTEDVRQFYDALLKRESVLYASKEGVAEEAADEHDNIDIRSPADAAADTGGALGLAMLTEVHLLNAQLSLFDDTGNLVTLVGPRAIVEMGTLLDGGAGGAGRVGSRTKVSMEDLVIYTSRRTAAGPEPFEKITAPTSAFVVFNSRDPLDGARDPAVLGTVGLDKGSTLTVFAPDMQLFMTSEQYGLLHELISSLLLYRDPGQHERAQQLEAIVLASDVLDKAAMLQNIEVLQLRIRSLEAVIIDLCCSSRQAGDRFAGLMLRLTRLEQELGLVVASMRTIKTSAERWHKRQLRLQLDVCIDQIRLTMLRPDKSPTIALTLQTIHDTWVSDEDFSMSNLLEIGVILALNRTPNSFYKTLVEPLPQSFYQSSGIGLGISDQTLRFYCKSLAPVGGIRVIEHAELNLAPLTIQLSYDIASEATKFFFPAATAAGSKDQLARLHDESFDAVEEEEAEHGFALVRDRSFKTKGGGSLSRMESMDGILGMRQRASDHCSFISVAVPAMQHFISYKGKEGTTLTDIENFMLRLPRFEYHNEILSWEEFFLQLRKDAVRVALMNAGSLLKEKIRRLGQSNLSEEQKMQRNTPVKKAVAAPADLPEQKVPPAVPIVCSSV